MPESIRSLQSFYTYRCRARILNSFPSSCVIVFFRSRIWKESANLSDCSRLYRLSQAKRRELRIVVLIMEPTCHIIDLSSKPHSNIFPDVLFFSLGFCTRNTGCVAMLQTVLRRVQAPVRGIPHFSSLRAFSYVSTHQTFPASLCLFHILRDSRLFDRAFEQGDREYEDGIEVSADGLVYPNINIECMDAKETSSFSSANLSSLQWSLTHAKHTLYAKDHTDVV